MPGSELDPVVDVPVGKLTESGVCPRCFGAGRVRTWIGVALVRVTNCRLCRHTGYHEIGVAG